MITRVTRKVYFLPIMSPSLPKKRAPNGRTTKPAAKVARVLNNAAVGFPEGKNLVEIIEARLPKM
jgi:hypothetical protein